MKTLFLLSILGLAASGLAGCGQAGNHANSMNHNSMMRTSNSSMNMNGMDHNSMPMNSNTSMDHSQMQSSPNAASQPYDLQFIDTMTAHHQGAVEMAKMVDGRTQNPDIKKFASQIIADQEHEIGQMKGWREKWFAGKPVALNLEMPGMIGSMKMDMAKLSNAKDRDFDLAFIDMMTPHHLGAILMAKEAVQKSERAEIKTLAGKIIKAQEAEVKMMSEWKTKWSK
jgi:uncharacterized protein (DUF305 family)